MYSHVNLLGGAFLSLKKTLWSFLIAGDQQFTTQSPRVSGTYLIDLGKMKG